MFETTIRRLLCCGFRCTGKVIRQVYHCWWRICQVINVFSRFEYHVLYPFVTYLLTVPRSLGKCLREYQNFSQRESKLLQIVAA
jgi:hypothetical protein